MSDQEQKDAQMKGVSTHQDRKIYRSPRIRLPKRGHHMQSYGYNVQTIGKYETYDHPICQIMDDPNFKITLNDGTEINNNFPVSVLELVFNVIRGNLKYVGRLIENNQVKYYTNISAFQDRFAFENITKLLTMATYIVITKPLNIPVRLFPSFSGDKNFLTTVSIEDDIKNNLQTDKIQN